MAVSDFINGAIREFAFRNYPVAMASACIALDASARKETPSLKVGERCRQFIDSNLDIITVVGTGGGTCAMPGAKLCPPDPRNPGAYTPIQDVIYESVRCCLIHEAELATHVSFTDDAFLGVRTTQLEISSRMIVALLLAVAATKVNAGIQIDDSWAIILDGRQIPFNQLFGDRMAVTNWLGITTTP